MNALTFVVLIYINFSFLFLFVINIFRSKSWLRTCWTVTPIHSGNQMEVLDDITSACKLWVVLLFSEKSFLLLGSALIQFLQYFQNNTLNGVSAFVALYLQDITISQNTRFFSFQIHFMYTQFILLPIWKTMWHPQW